MDGSYRLEDYYSPSPPCDCEICQGYCKRPGWWTVEQAARAMTEGISCKMMLEISPDFTFAVLSPAFKGCEGLIAINEFANQGCTFFQNSRCKLHHTSLQPLECSVCHHSTPGLGPKIHAELEKEWNSIKGQKIVINWMKETGFWEKLSKAPQAFRKIRSSSKYRPGQ